MTRKMLHTVGERIAKLRRAEALIAGGATIGAAAISVGVKYGTLYHWRRRYLGLTESAASRLRHLEIENMRLRRALLELDPGSVIARARRYG